MEVRSDRRYRLPAAPAVVWSALERTGEYPSWWPWLRTFDAIGLVEGDVWRCTVRPPLPYLVRFDLTVETVRPPHAVTATIDGDIAGTATIGLTPIGADTELRLTADLRPARRTFAVLARVARPLVTRGHDWVLDTGARQFAERALGA